jgi:hypothetical protein
MWRKIQGWKENIMSRIGKEILVKAVAQAIPVFAMSCFDITKTFCDDIISMCVITGGIIKRKDIVWRVGDGANIMALDDP